MILTTVVIFLAIFGVGAGIEETVLAWGNGMWALLEIGMQFTILMVAAHACVSSRPVFRLLDRPASLPDRERPVQAVVLVGAYSLITAYLNWAFCLVASAILIPFVARRNPNTDIRILITSGYLGLGTIWHGGLSGSAPLILATPGNPLIAPSSGVGIIDRLLPVTETLFTPFNLFYLIIISAVSLTTIALLHPQKNIRTLTRKQAEQMMPILPAKRRNLVIHRLES